MVSSVITRVCLLLLVQVAGRGWWHCGLHDGELAWNMDFDTVYILQ